MTNEAGLGDVQDIPSTLKFNQTAALRQEVGVDVDYVLPWVLFSHFDHVSISFARKVAAYFDIRQTRP